MVHFGWLSIVLLLGAAQGAVVSALLFARTPNRVANSILGAFLLLFVARIVPYIIGFAGFYDRYPWLSFAPFGITLAVGPLLYMYVVRITTDRLPGRWWLHLVPAAVQLAYYLSVFFQPLTFKNDFNARIHRPFIDPAESLLLFVSLTAYLIAAIVRYRRYEVWLRDSTSDPLLYSVSWLRTFLILFTVTVALNSGFEAYSLLVHPLSYFSFFWLYAWFAIVVDYLALEGWRNAGRAYPEPQVVLETLRPAAVKLPEDLAPAAIAWRERFRAEGHWKEPQLTLSLLAERTNESSTNISRLVNEGLGQNFSEVVNRIRVAAVQERLRDITESRDLLELALEAGFNSKASFNRSFKAFANVTPTAYRKSNAP